MNTLFYHFFLRLYRSLILLINTYFPERTHHKFQLIARLTRALFFPQYDPFFPSNTIRSKNINSDHDFSVPNWITNEMRILGLKVDHQLYPDATTLAKYRYAPMAIIPAPGLALDYLLKQCLHPPYSHLFILPWIKRGGADKIALHFINTIADSNNSNVCVLLTTQESSEWINRLDKRVTVAHFNSSVAMLPLTERNLTLITFAECLSVSYIHIINSKEALESLVSFGQALRQRCKIVMHLFCENYGPDGQLHGYGTTFLPIIYECLFKVVTDNNYIIHQLHNLYGFPHSLFEKVPTPVGEPSLGALRLLSKPDQRMRVLWAGRLDRQKRPDLLLEIARNAPEFDFAYIGYPSLDPMFHSLRALNALPNVRYLGGFDTPDELRVEEYDVFLYTSQWDGLPVVLLEVGQAGIPIIAPDVGGVSELVSNDTGFLVSPFNDTDAYIRILHEINSNRTEAHRRTVAMAAFIRNNHSVSTFRDQLASIYL